MQIPRVVLQLRGSSAPIGHVVRQCPAADHGREGNAGDARDVLRPGLGGPHQGTGQGIPVRHRTPGRVPIDDVPDEEPRRPSLGQRSDARGGQQKVPARGIHVLVGVEEVAPIEATFRCADRAVAHPRIRGQGVASPPQLLGVVRQPLVQPQEFAVAAPGDDVLAEADHVLKFVDECHRHEVLHFRRGVRAAQGTAGIGDDRIKDLALVGARVVAERRIEVGPEKESRDKPARVALAGGHQLVHGVRHQHKHDAVRIDVGLTPKGGRVDCVETRIERVGDTVERRRIEATRGRQRVDVDGDLGLESAHARPHPVEARAVGLGTHLKRAQRAHPGRVRSGRRLRHRARAIAWLRSKSPRSPFITQAQKPVKLLGGSERRTRLDRRRRRRENRIAAQPKRGRLTWNAGRQLGNEEVLSSKCGSRGKDHATGVGRRIDRHVLIDGEVHGRIRRRTAPDLRSGTNRTRCRYQQAQWSSQPAQSYQAFPDHAPPL